MKPRLMACYAQISNYFVQSNKETTPIGVKHVFAEHAWSTFLLLNVLEWFEILCFFSPWFLIALVGQSLRPVKDPFFFGNIHLCQHIGVRQCQCVRV